jgi:peptidoglycan-associated lipoprotein
MFAKFRAAVPNPTGRAEALSRLHNPFIMKYALYLRLLLAVTLVAAVATTGCKKKPKSPTPIPGAQRGVGGAGSETAAVPPGSTLPTDGSGSERTSSVPGPGDSIPLPSVGPEGFRENLTALAAYTVYFDFDRSSVKASERSKIEAVANYLKDHTTDKVRVGGYCDDRGTEGYNLALGERRALAVREYLVRLGISGDRVYTISYGEAFPAVEGRTESAYSKNRRCAFVLLEP